MGFLEFYFLPEWILFIVLFHKSFWLTYYVDKYDYDGKPDAILKNVSQF